MNIKSKTTAQNIESKHVTINLHNQNHLQFTNNKYN